ncbi:hypothetical protein OROMI_032862 [Orobanche minor]
MEELGLERQSTHSSFVPSLLSLFIKMGFPGGLADSESFCSETDREMTMMPSGEGGRSFRWTDLFGSSSTGNSEASVNQPAPDSPNPGEPAAPIFPEAEVYHPLQEDGQRRQELTSWFSEDSLMYKRHQIRGILFYPHGKAFSLQTYAKDLNVMENHGTHRSLPYQRLMEA